MRPTIESGDFATHVERELPGISPPGMVTPPLSTSTEQTPSSVMQRIMAALLSVLGAATFAGVGIAAIVTGVSSGRNRFTGKEVVLTGSNATLLGLLCIAFAAIFFAMFLRQLPVRLGKGTILVIVALVVAALTFAFGVMSY